MVWEEKSLHETFQSVRLVPQNLPTYLSSFISGALQLCIRHTELVAAPLHIPSFPTYVKLLILSSLPARPPPPPIPMEILAILQDPAQMSSPLWRPPNLPHWMCVLPPLNEHRQSFLCTSFSWGTFLTLPICFLLLVNLQPLHTWDFKILGGKTILLTNLHHPAEQITFKMHLLNISLDWK